MASSGIEALLERLRRPVGRRLQRHEYPGHLHRDAHPVQLGGDSANAAPCEKHLDDRLPCRIQPGGRAHHAWDRHQPVGVSVLNLHDLRDRPGICRRVGGRRNRAGKQRAEDNQAGRYNSQTKADTETNANHNNLLPKTE